MQRGTQGKKYDKSLTTKQITQIIRNNIKQAKKDGILPQDLRVSVRMRKVTWDHAIDMTITKLDTKIFNEEFIRWEMEHPHDPYPANIPRYEPETQRILDMLRGFHDDYNYDRSDSMTDYFDVNYYGGVSIDFRLEEQAREVLRSRIESGADNVVKALEETVDQHRDGIKVEDKGDRVVIESDHPSVVEATECPDTFDTKIDEVLGLDVTVTLPVIGKMEIPGLWGSFGIAHIAKGPLGRKSYLVWRNTDLFYVHEWPTGAFEVYRLGEEDPYLVGDEGQLRMEISTENSNA